MGTWRWGVRGGEPATPPTRRRAGLSHLDCLGQNGFGDVIGHGGTGPGVDGAAESVHSPQELELLELRLGRNTQACPSLLRAHLGRSGRPRPLSDHQPARRPGPRRAGPAPLQPSGVSGLRLYEQRPFARARPGARPPEVPGRVFTTQGGGETPSCSPFPLGSRNIPRERPYHVFSF